MIFALNLHDHHYSPTSAGGVVRSLLWLRSAVSFKETAASRLIQQLLKERKAQLETCVGRKKPIDQLCGRHASIAN